MNEPIYIGDLIRWRAVKKALESLPKKKGGVCLDVGCGARLYKELVESCGYAYDGMDIKPLPGVTEGDAHNLPYPDKSFDLVLCIDVLEHTQMPEKVLSEIKRVTNEFGFIIIHVPNSESTHILVEPEEQADHKRKGFCQEEMKVMTPYLTKTFKLTECIAWELIYIINHHLNLDLNKLLDFKISRYKNLGWLAVMQP
jgi:ubiquinone/menaquinone biosynthesis C-methylase UbiE